MRNLKILKLTVLAVLFLQGTGALQAFELVPGVYREYLIDTRSGLSDAWRVTDPGTSNPGALVFLPNHVFTFTGVDLSGAVRAEITMHHWAGHSGSTGQQIIINGDHHADVPINENIEGVFIQPAAAYLNCDNPIIEIPLEWLQDGNNTIEGTFSEEMQGEHSWGQWGWWWIGLRIHLDPAQTDIPGGELTVEVPYREISSDSVQVNFVPDGEGINSVTFFARYYGFDEDGDYVFDDWHGFGNRYAAAPEGSIGRDMEAPFSGTWDLTRVPDQPEDGKIAFAAIIRRGANEYRVCEPVEGYSLKRDYSLKLFRPLGFSSSLIRNGISAGARLSIPASYPLQEAAEARMLVRTWNGRNNEEGSTPFSFNYKPYHYGLVTGQNHDYGFDNVPVQVEELISGTNLLNFTSNTVHHGCELLVPGPTLLLRWDYPVPDYLDTSTFIKGWYHSAAGRAYYDPDTPEWQFSATLGWINKKRPTSPTGWYYSTRKGFLWASKDFPYVWLAEEQTWIYNPW